MAIAALIAVMNISCSQTKNLHHAIDGFKPIFDGKSLLGWQGDKTYWRVENGSIIGEVKPETLLKRNTFLIWQGARPANFELVLDYRISAAGNSGVNYRSIVIDTLPFAMMGYQADIDGKNKYGLGYPRYSGQNYEERGRQFLALRGQRVVIEAGQKPRVVDSLGSDKELREHIHFDDWNELRIIARGNTIQHYINGKLMSEVTDNDLLHSKMSGSIGVQVHVGPPMKVEYRNIRLKQ